MRKIREYFYDCTTLRNVHATTIQKKTNKKRIEIDWLLLIFKMKSDSCKIIGTCLSF